MVYERSDINLTLDFQIVLHKLLENFFLNFLPRIEEIYKISKYLLNFWIKLSSTCSNFAVSKLVFVYNILFCFEGETHTESDSERKQHFLQHKENTIITRKPIQIDQRP